MTRQPNETEGINKRSPGLLVTKEQRGGTGQKRGFSPGGSYAFYERKKKKKGGESIAIRNDLNIHVTNWGAGGIESIRAA